MFFIFLRLCTEIIGILLSCVFSIIIFCYFSLHMISTKSIYISNYRVKRIQWMLYILWSVEKRLVVILKLFKVYQKHNHNINNIYIREVDHTMLIALKILYILKKHSIFIIQKFTIQCVTQFSIYAHLSARPWVINYTKTHTACVLNEWYSVIYSDILISRIKLIFNDAW